MGLATPAMFAIEMNRPLAFVYSSVVHVAAPVASVIFSPQLLGEIAQLLEDRSNLDRLIARIEELADEDDRRRREAARARRGRRPGGLLGWLREARTPPERRS